MLDAKEISINCKPLIIANIIRRLDDNTIEFRKDTCWSTPQKIKLIESILIKIPMPSFYISCEKDNIWNVIDGAERIKAIYEFISDELPLEALDYLPLNGVRYSALAKSMQRRVLETNIIVYLIDAGTPKDVLDNLRKRISDK